MSRRTFGTGQDHTPELAGTSDWAPDIVIIAVNVTAGNPPFCWRDIKRRTGSDGGELTSTLDSARTTDELVLDLYAVQTTMTGELRAEYDKKNPPQLYSASKIADDYAVQARQTELIVLPIAAIVTLAIAAFFEYRRRTGSGGSGDGDSAGFDWDFDDGGD